MKYHGDNPILMRFDLILIGLVDIRYRSTSDYISLLMLTSMLRQELPKIQLKDVTILIYRRIVIIDGEGGANFHGLRKIRNIHTSFCIS